MKLFTSIVALVFLLNIVFTPTVSLAADLNTQEASRGGEIVDVYAVFWPIVPGKTVADPMFWTKQLKETFSGLFTFGLVNKSGNNIEISEKRLVEASSLFDSKDYTNAQKSLVLNKAARDEALRLKKKAAEGGQDVYDLTSRLVKSLENQQKVLMFLSTQVPQDQMGEIDDMVKDLTLQISEAK